MNTKSTEASSREQLRIAEEEGKLPPGRHRKRPVETQNASLTENTLSTGHPDAQKVRAYMDAPVCQALNS